MCLIQWRLLVLRWEASGWRRCENSGWSTKARRFIKAIRSIFGKEAGRRTVAEEWRTLWYQHLVVSWHWYGAWWRDGKVIRLWWWNFAGFWWILKARKIRMMNQARNDYFLNENHKPQNTHPSREEWLELRILGWNLDARPNKILFEILMIDKLVGPLIIKQKLMPLRQQRKSREFQLGFNSRAPLFIISLKLVMCFLTSEFTFLPAI